jgi:hypothetical protein
LKADCALCDYGRACEYGFCIRVANMTSTNDSKSDLLAAINIIEDIIELAHRKRNRFSHDEIASAAWSELHEKLYICWNQLKCVETNIDGTESIAPPAETLKSKLLKKLKK